MKLIDRYIIKKFLVTFIFTIGLFALIAIFIDITEKLDDFLKHKPPLLTIIFGYYIYFLPWFFGLFGPIFVFLSCMFFNAKLAQNTEIIAILNSGANYLRFLRPYFLGASFLVAFFIFLNTYLIPISDRHRYAFEEEWIHDKKTTQSDHLHVQIEPGTMMFIESFNYLDSTGTNLTMERYANSRIVQRIFASRIIWNKEKSMWSMENYQQRIFTPEGEVLKKGMRKDTMLTIKPSEFIIKDQFTSAMTNAELNDYIRKEKERGSPKINAYYVELYRRLASAFSFYPITLLAVAISSRKARGGIGFHLGIGIMITLAYLLVVQVFNTLGISNVLNPAVAVWTPAVMLMFVALYMARKSPK